MEENGIKPEHRLICFGQLFGMSDHISFNLGLFFTMVEDLGN